MAYPALPDLLSLKGKRALITGAASGIGKAITLRFAEAGASLELVDRDEEGLRHLQETLRESQVEVHSHQVDLSRKEEIEALWARLKGRSVEILVNNAGAYTFRPFEEIDEAFYDGAMAVNLDAVFWMCQAFIRALPRGQGGAIVNISSVEAFLPFAEGLAHYDAAKLGVVALTRAIAREFGRRGIRANVLVPGGIRTEGVRRLQRETLRKLNIRRMILAFHFNARLPMGRFGDPDEVARAALFLASDLASYVNGAVLAVDGGFLSS